MKRIIFAVLLIAAGAIGSASAEIIQCGSGTSPISYAGIGSGSGSGSGSITIDYDVCVWTDGSVTGTMLYNNVSFDGYYWINGLIALTGNSLDSDLTYVLNGGPLTYTFVSTPYTVFLNNLTFNFDSFTGQQTTAGGLFTFNGRVYVADNTYLQYRYR